MTLYDTPGTAATTLVHLTGAHRALVQATAVCTGLSAGVFFAFSTFVMPALRRLPASDGLRAMQAINKAAPNPLFMAVLFAPIVAGGVLTVRLLRTPGRSTGYVIAATVCVAVGLVVTIAYHVPHNDALARVTVGPAGEDSWRRYAGPWAAWNHVRTVAFTAATGLLALALRSD